MGRPVAVGVGLFGVWWLCCVGMSCSSSSLATTENDVSENRTEDDGRGEGHDQWSRNPDLVAVPDGEDESRDVPDVSSLPDALPLLPPDLVWSTPYLAGVASRDVTPWAPMFLGGFGFCAGKIEACRLSEGVHDPIEVNVVALAEPQSGEVVFFVSVDSVGFIKFDIDWIHEAASQALAQRFGIHLDPPPGGGGCQSCPLGTGYLWTVGTHGRGNKRRGMVYLPCS